LFYGKTFVESSYVIPAKEPEMDSIPYLKERQLPLCASLSEDTPPCAPLSEGGRGEQAPYSRIQCEAGKSGMTERINHFL